MNDTWQTPDELFKSLNQMFKFDFDLCANAANTKCEDWADNLWQFRRSESIYKYKSYWMNPPYSRGNINECMRAAVQIVKLSKASLVTLVRCDPSAKWFQHCVNGVAKEVWMLDKRVKFKGASSAYNFPCCLCIYDFEPVHNTEYKIVSLEYLK